MEYKDFEMQYRIKRGWGSQYMYELKWPRQDADISKVDKNSIYKIELYGAGDHAISFFDYSRYFSDAAHIATEYILDRGNISELDNYFFPIAYMYRHSLELVLKAIAFKYINDKVTFIKDTFHNLAEILFEIEPYLREQIQADSEAFKWLCELLQDMSPIDKDSDAFRYPFKIIVEKDWEIKRYEIKKFFEGQKHINLVNFASKMEVAYGILKSYYLEENITPQEYKQYSTVFLEEGGQFYYQSVIGYDYYKDLYGPMIKGYSETGEFLGYCMSNDISKCGSLFFPMCYLYRNAIELELKQIWFEQCGASFSEKCRKLSKCKHSFQKMWNLINGTVLKHSKGQGDISAISFAESYIAQLHSIDSTSSVFRYPTDKEMNYHFKSKKNIDTKNVANFLEEISQFLQAVDSMMDDHNQILADMTAEYASYY